MTDTEMVQLLLDLGIPDVYVQECQGLWGEAQKTLTKLRTKADLIRQLSEEITKVIEDFNEHTPLHYALIVGVLEFVKGDIYRKSIGE